MKITSNQKSSVEFRRFDGAMDCRRISCSRFLVRPEAPCGASATRSSGGCSENHHVRGQGMLAEDRDLEVDRRFGRRGAGTDVCFDDVVDVGSKHLEAIADELERLRLCGRFAGEY